MLSCCDDEGATHSAQQPAPASRIDCTLPKTAFQLASNGLWELQSSISAAHTGKIHFSVRKACSQSIQSMPMQ